MDEDDMVQDDEMNMKDREDDKEVSSEDMKWRTWRRYDNEVRMDAIEDSMKTSGTWKKERLQHREHRRKTARSAYRGSGGGQSRRKKS